MPPLIAITAIAVAVAAVFSPGHIALTAAITGVLGLLILRWRLRSLAVGESIVIALIVAASVLMWRLSANMPQLNSDGTCCAPWSLMWSWVSTPPPGPLPTQRGGHRPARW